MTASSARTLRALTTIATLLALGCGRTDPAPGRTDPAAPAGRPSAEPPLLLHVGGTMRPAMEEICRLFEAETGTKVELNFNDSGAILTVIETTGKGDACVVHDPFGGALEKRGFADRRWTPATLTPVIVVPKGNPKGVMRLEDLARDDVKVGLTDAAYSTAGHIVTVAFRRAGIAEAMGNKSITRARGGGEIANAVKIGTVDAGIVWDAVAFERRDALDAIPIAREALPQPGVDAVTSATFGAIDMSSTRVEIVTLKGSKRLESARRLAELTASAKGRAVFAARGFSPAPGGGAAREPGLSGSLLVCCAAGLQEPVSEIARLFEADTGVKVELTFASSGQLLAQIATSRKGDVYVPGDVGFADMARAKDLTEGRPRDFCWLVPVVMVGEGNPKGILRVADLARPGLRIALADEASAIGKLQPEIFRKGGVDPEAVRKNAIATPATVNEVALAVKLRTADAGLVWDSTAAMYPAEADAVAIPFAENSVGTAAACALAGSSNPEAAAAFVANLGSEAARAVLRSRHFTVDEPGPAPDGGS